jgi:hypothetical protein
MLSYGTVLRYYPEEETEEHYTAYVFDAKGTINEVHSPNFVKKEARSTMYKSIETWLASIDPSITVDHLHINMRRPIKEVCHVPPKTDVRSTMKWGRYIYEILHMYTPHLLSQDVVVSAYNTLITALEGFACKVIVWIPYRAMRYMSAIRLKPGQLLPLTCNCAGENQANNFRYENNGIIYYLHTAYMELYQHIIADLTAHIDAKQKLYEEEVKNPHYKRRMIKAITQRMRTESLLNSRLATYTSNTERRLAELTKKHESRVDTKRYVQEVEIKRMEQTVAPALLQKRIQSSTNANERAIAKMQHRHEQRMHYLRAKAATKAEELRGAYQVQLDRLSEHIAFYMDKLGIEFTGQ